MPTYAYRCESCGYQEDVRQKMADPHLTHCPSCAQDAFRRQLTAPNFQLKGSGWYVTDFRGEDKSSSGTKKSESSTSAQATNESSTSGSNNTDTTSSANSTKESSTNKATPTAVSS